MLDCVWQAIPIEGFCCAHYWVVMYRHHCVKLAFPERPLASGPSQPVKALPFKPPQQSSTALTTSPYRVYLAWNESPNPECLRPSCNFDHICNRYVHTNVTDKQHKALYCPYKQKHPRYIRNQDKAPQSSCWWLRTSHTVKYNSWLIITTKQSNGLDHSVMHINNKYIEFKKKKE